MRIDLLQKKMETMGLTQRDVAERARISRSAFNRKMNGVSPFDVDEAMRVLYVLGIVEPKEIVEYMGSYDFKAWINGQISGAIGGERVSHTTDSPKAFTDASNEMLHGAFEAIDSALWSAVEYPIGGIDSRLESLDGCIECLEAYIEARRKAFDELLHDPRFWCFPVSRRPAEVMADSGEDKPDDRAMRHWFARIRRSSCLSTGAPTHRTTKTI